MPQPTSNYEDRDSGLLSLAGLAVCEAYAKRWLNDGHRDLDLERANPDLVGVFYDIRHDSEYALIHATSVEL